MTKAKRADGAKVNGTPSGELDKRFYMKGVTITAKCPACKEPVVRDFNDNYLSYPNMNEPTGSALHCFACEYEWRIKVRVAVALELLEDDE